MRDTTEEKKENGESQKLTNKDIALHQVCDSLDLMKIMAVHMGDLRGIQDIRINIEKLCPGKKQKDS